MIKIDSNGQFAEVRPDDWSWSEVAICPNVTKSHIDAANEMLAKAEAARSSQIFADLQAKTEALNKAMRPLHDRQRALRKAQARRPKPQLAKSMRWSTLLDELDTLARSDAMFGDPR